jgi:hypothetical protein
MSSGWDDSAQSAIQRLDGVPNRLNAPKERQRWQRFVEWFCPWLSDKHELAQQYVQATVDLQKAQADKVGREAAEIAARTDIAQQDAVQKFCDIVDGLNTKDPDATDALKLAKLLEANPGVADQLDKIREMMESLRRTSGTTIAALPESLPEPASDGLG